MRCAAERIVELARASGERRQEGATLAHLAFAHFITTSAETDRFATGAASIARQIGDQEVLAKSLSLLGIVEQAHGRIPEADRMFSESLQIAEPNGFAVIAYQARFWLALQREWQGHFTATRAIYRRVEEDARAALTLVTPSRPEERTVRTNSDDRLMLHNDRDFEEILGLL